MAKACREVGCALMGGETAEMPGVYNENEHDIAGCMVGIVDRKNSIDISKIKPGDVLIALPSNGLHTNGYSLARKVLIDESWMNVNEYVKELGCSVGEELLRPHKSYSKPVLALNQKIKIKGIAHITGGGLVENVPRMLPKGIGAEIDEQKIKVQPIFTMLQEKGNISREEMYRVFNMGVGLIIAVAKPDAEKAMKILAKSGQDSYYIGRAVKGEGVRFKR